MAHDVHDPVITTDTEGNYIHTSCRECGMQLDAPEAELTPAQKGAATRAANRAAAEAELAAGEETDETVEALTEDEFYETPAEETV